MASDRQRLQPRKQPRQARAELTRQRILEAAAHVFADHGYAAGTTNRIAARAGVSIGSLYQYYPSKDALLLALTTAHIDSGMAAARRLRADALPDALEDIIRVFVRTTIGNHTDHPQLLRILLEQAPRTPELMAKIYAYEEASVAFVEALLGRHPEVRVGDTHTAARLVVSTIELLVHQLVAPPAPVDVPRFENELVAMLTRYLTAAPAPGPLG
ncbi:TetR/AcrR family transcriptional regulator [Streptomyces sp. NPDC050161]|uniref:TetR/AcrR family transcriptional regulator n=1 Tax=Streptomyces sp. NPDC050161 TaxID=3365604 RepID=UPI0037A0ABA6